MVGELERIRKDEIPPGSTEHIHGTGESAGFAQFVSLFTDGSLCSSILRNFWTSLECRSPEPCMGVTRSYATLLVPRGY
jgi:hypothetical protein